MKNIRASLSNICKSQLENQCKSGWQSEENKGYLLMWSTQKKLREVSCPIFLLEVPILLQTNAVEKLMIWRTWGHNNNLKKTKNLCGWDGQQEKQTSKDPKDIEAYFFQWLWVRILYKATLGNFGNLCCSKYLMTCMTAFTVLDVCFTYTFSHASRHTLKVQDESSERNCSVQSESGSYSSLSDHKALLSATLPDVPVVFTVQVVLYHNTKYISKVSDLHWRRICLLVSVLTGTFISKVQEQISVHI